tara:strand:- start:574 stop:792 length:219 start_codon:yes stop_codon:yes gene_type:complete
MDIDTMDNLAKAISYMNFMEMDYEVVGNKMFITAWNKSLSETLTFQLAQDAIDTMAEAWDNIISNSKSWGVS